MVLPWIRLCASRATLVARLAFVLALWTRSEAKYKNVQIASKTSARQSGARTLKSVSSKKTGKIKSSHASTAPEG